jgi:hypothetical protein
MKSLPVIMFMIGFIYALYLGDKEVLGIVLGMGLLSIPVGGDYDYGC